MSERNHRLSNTEYERLALSARVNLADGHARHPLSPRQRKIVDDASVYFDLALRQPQETSEDIFLRAFFGCARQSLDSVRKPFLCYSSSDAIKIAAQYCRIKGLNVGLIEPCFDNIRHMLETEGVVVEPISEGLLLDPETLSAYMAVPNAAIWLVLPNNPTGFILDKDQFSKISQLASENGCTLIVDFCFRFFADSMRSWDQYKILKSSDTRFICFEDTGKTWPLCDAKVGMTVCSEDAMHLLHRLHDELLLNVSPWILLMLAQLIDDTAQRGMVATSRNDVDGNRRLVHRLLDSGILHHSYDCRNVPMEFLGLPSSLDATEFWRRLRTKGVDILPAHNYYWSNGSRDLTRFRIPLSRPRRDIELAVPIIEATLATLGVRDASV